MSNRKIAMIVGVTGSNEKCMLVLLDRSETSETFSSRAEAIRFAESKNYIVVNK